MSNHICAENEKARVIVRPLSWAEKQGRVRVHLSQEVPLQCERPRGLSVSFPYPLQLKITSPQFPDLANFKMLSRKTISLCILEASKSGLFSAQVSAPASVVERT